MSSSTAAPSSSNSSSLRPIANTMPRRVSDSRTPFKNSSRASLKLSGLHCRLFHQVAVESVTDSVPAKKTKSISALDKEEEAQMVKLYNDQSKKGVARMVNWLQDKVKTGDVKKD